MAASSLAWLPVTRRWNARAHLCWASNTLLFGETSSALGRALLSRGWGGIQPWTWVYYNYEPAAPANPMNGWLMIDHKTVTYPIGYTGSFFTNETPFTSNHGNGGVNVSMCDGSVRYLTQETPLTILQALATRQAEPLRRRDHQLVAAVELIRDGDFPPLERRRALDRIASEMQSRTRDLGGVLDRWIAESRKRIGHTRPPPELVAQHDFVPDLPRGRIDLVAEEMVDPEGERARGGTACRAAGGGRDRGPGEREDENDERELCRMQPPGVEGFVGHFALLR